MHEGMRVARLRQNGRKPLKIATRDLPRAATHRAMSAHGKLVPDSCCSKCQRRPAAQMGERMQAEAPFKFYLAGLAASPYESSLKPSPYSNPGRRDGTTSSYIWATFQIGWPTRLSPTCGSTARDFVDVSTCLATDSQKTNNTYTRIVRCAPPAGAEHPQISVTSPNNILNHGAWKYRAYKFWHASPRTVP